jgi:hypothetical protein
LSGRDAGPTVVYGGRPVIMGQSLLTMIDVVTFNVIRIVTGPSGGKIKKGPLSRTLNVDD